VSSGYGQEIEEASSRERYFHNFVKSAQVRRKRWVAGQMVNIQVQPKAARAPVADGRKFAPGVFEQRRERHTEHTSCNTKTPTLLELARLTCAHAERRKFGFHKSRTARSPYRTTRHNATLLFRAYIVQFLPRRHGIIHHTRQVRRDGSRRI